MSVVPWRAAPVDRYNAAHPDAPLGSDSRGQPVLGGPLNPGIANPSDPILKILQSYGGRQGVGFSLQRLAEVASLGLDRAQTPFEQIDPLLGRLFDQARSDVAGAFGAERTRVADTQRALQSRLSQQLGRSGLGSLRATASAGLEQQGLRRQQEIADRQGRSLGALAAQEGVARAGGLQSLGGFLERRGAIERDLAQMKTEHIVGRKTAAAQRANAIAGAIGSIGGAIIGGPIGAGIGNSLFSSAAGSPMGGFNPYTQQYTSPIGPTP